MPSMNVSIEVTVHDRMIKYRKDTNKKRTPEKLLHSNTDIIDDLLTKAGH